MKKQIILASGSPRRKSICEKYGLSPKIIKPDVIEKQRKFEDPYETVMALAFEKAYSVSRKLSGGELVMASDTMVFHEGKKLGKPESEEEAFRTLRSLSGRTHKVISGLAILEAGSNLKIIDYVETSVRFKNLTDEKIKNYIETKEPLDKAGSYGIQGFGQILVESIEGSYLNVVGFPIERVADILEDYFDIELI